LVALVMEGVALGGIGTLMPSMMMTVFGADQYASVSRTIQTIGNVVRSFAFMIISIGYTLFGGYSKAPWLLAIATVVALLLIIGIKPETKPEAEQKS
ncbi:MAG: hypothetical protein LUD71_03485, partial [Clostridiales bacterium]|nr:hypothetical protein [Clostridiales bacterium]